MTLEWMQSSSPRCIPEVDRVNEAVQELCGSQNSPPESAKCLKSIVEMEDNGGLW